MPDSKVEDSEQNHPARSLTISLLLLDDKAKVSLLPDHRAPLCTKLKMTRPDIFVDAV